MRPPAPLAWLLAVVAVFGVAWSLLVPPFQEPDEGAHFAYAQSLAERFALPGDPHRGIGSDDQAAIDQESNASTEEFAPQLTNATAWNPSLNEAYKRRAAADPSRSNGGGPNPASVNPPLYYLYDDIGYWITYAGNGVDRLYAMRIWSDTLLLLTVLGAWLLAGEVLGRRRLAQLACAATAGLVPMETAISSSINPDGMLVATWTFALWLGARVILRGGRRRDVVALGAVTGAAIMTKSTSYALVLPVLLAMALGWRRAAPGERDSVAPVIALGVLAAPVLGWVALTRSLARPALNGVPGGGTSPIVTQFLSYVEQFYLPRIPGLTPLRRTPGLPLYETWIRQGWGVFGWVSVPMPEWIYGVLSVVSAGVAALAVNVLARFRDRRRLELLAFFAFCLVALLGLLHVTDYLQIIGTGYTLLQGRYVLPLVALFGLAVGLCITRLPARWRGPGCGAVLAGLLVLQVLALATVGRGFYT